jgi:hypothetical protein
VIAEQAPARSNGLHPGGRPTIRTEANAAIIVRTISEGGTFKEAAEAVGIAIATIKDWERENPEFATALAQARIDWADVKSEEMLHAQEEEPRMIVGEDGTARVDSGWVQHITSRANYTKWLIAKRDPKRFGDAAASTTVNVGVGVTVVRESLEELRARLAARERESLATERAHVLTDSAQSEVIIEQSAP